MIAPPHEAAPLSLQAAIDHLADQLCVAVEGSFAFSVNTTSEEPVVRKLASLINLTLDKAGHSLATVEQQRGELQFKNELYHGLFQHMSDGVLVCDPTPDGCGFVLSDINKAALQIEGTSRKEVLGHDLASAFAGTAGAELLAAMQKVSRTGRPQHLPAHRCVNDRVDYWGESYIFALPTGTLVVVFRDVTTRRAAELALRESLANTERIVDAVPFAIVVIGTDHAIWHANTAASVVLGESPHDLTGRNWCGFIVDPTVCECLAGGNPNEVRTVECRIRNGRGEPVPVLLSVIPISFGEEEAFLAAFLDLTERQRLELQLRQAQKLEAVGSLAAGIAHEINTPTQYIGDNLHFLADAFASLGQAVAASLRLAALVRAGEATPAEADVLEQAFATADLPYFMEELPTALAQASDGVTRVAQIVQAMKDFSHPGNRQMAASDLNQAIRSTTVVSRNAWKYVADLECDLAPDLPPVICLIDEFNQVILNLIVNAAHAIEERVGRDGGSKGRITIATRREGDVVEIRVRDTGAGIPESVRDRLFEPFFTTKTVGRGTGQGLAIAHNVIVDKHHGTIGFESVVGEGTEFRIGLPLTGASPPEKEIAT